MVEEVTEIGDTVVHLVVLAVVVLVANQTKQDVVLHQENQELQEKEIPEEIARVKDQVTAALVAVAKVAAAKMQLVKTVVMAVALALQVLLVRQSPMQEAVVAVQRMEVLMVEKVEALVEVKAATMAVKTDNQVLRIKAPEAEAATLMEVQLEALE